MKNLVDTRRAGNSIYYRLRDPQIRDVLDAARRIFDAHVIQLRAVSEEEPMNDMASPPPERSLAAGSQGA